MADGTFGSNVTEDPSTPLVGASSLQFMPDMSQFMGGDMMMGGDFMGGDMMGGGMGGMGNWTATQAKWASSGMNMTKDFAGKAGTWAGTGKGATKGAATMAKTEATAFTPGVISETPATSTV